MQLIKKIKNFHLAVNCQQNPGTGSGSGSALIKNAGSRSTSGSALKPMLIRKTGICTDCDIYSKTDTAATVSHKKCHIQCCICNKPSFLQ
jgi:hypothetical protein